MAHKFDSVFKEAIQEGSSTQNTMFINENKQIFTGHRFYELTSKRTFSESMLYSVLYNITFLHLSEILRMEFMTGIPPCFSKGKTELENWNELFLGQIMYVNY